MIVMIVMSQGEYCHCDYCKCKHGYGQDSKVCNIIVMRNFNEMYFRDIKGVRDTDKMCSDVLLCRTISFDIIFLIYCYDLEIYSIFLNFSSNTFNSLHIEFNFIEDNVPESKNIITGHIEPDLLAT